MTIMCRFRCITFIEYMYMYILTGKILLDPTNHFILMTIKIMDSTWKTNMPKEDASYMNLDLKIDETRQESIFWKK